MGIDRDGVLHVIWTINIHPYSQYIQYRRKSSAGWGDIETLVGLDSYTKVAFSLIWALWPTVNGVHTNVKGTGFIFQYYATSGATAGVVRCFIRDSLTNYYFSLPDVNLTYVDEDGTKELHVILHNLSPTTKNAGDTGQVVLEVTYIPMA